MKKLLSSILAFAMVFSSVGLNISNAFAATVDNPTNDVGNRLIVAEGRLEKQNPVLVKTDAEEQAFYKNFAENILTDDMSVVEKLDKIGEFAANYTYSNDITEWNALREKYGCESGTMMQMGVGDCIMFANLCINLAKAEGYTGKLRAAMNDAGAASNHREPSILATDGRWYSITVGKRNDEERWSVIDNGKGFEYFKGIKTTYSGEKLSRNWFLQYDGDKTEINLNDGIDSWKNGPKEITAIIGQAMECSPGVRTVIIPSSVNYVDDLSKGGGITYIFEGDAPDFPDGMVFLNTNATVYYPADNTTWTQEIMNAMTEDLGETGKVQWISYTDINDITDSGSVDQPSEKTDFSKAVISLSQSSYQYDGKVKTPNVTVTLDSKTLTEGTDYTVAYENNINAGTATVKITGMGNYTGILTKTFTITKAAGSLNFENKAVTKKTNDTTFTNFLTKKGDGTVNYTSSNTNVATVDNSGNVTIKGAGTTTITAKLNEGANYTGTSASYTLTVTEYIPDPIDISTCTISLGTDSYTYNGNVRKPVVTIRNGSTTLKENTDYVLSYSNNVNAGTAKVTVNGIGKYDGSVIKTFTINKAQGSLKYATASISKKTNDASFTNPLTKNGDGTVSYTSSNTNVAVVDSNGKITIKGAGTTTITAKMSDGTNYKGSSATYTLTVTKSFVDINNCSVTLDTAKYVYDGKAKTPSLTVKNGSTTLKSGTDYTVSYSNNVNAGTAKVIITGKGDYTGTVTKTFTIDKADYTVAVKDYNGTYDSKSHTITLRGVKGGSTIKYRSSKNGEWTIKKPTRTSAGTTTVYYQITNPNYKTVTGSQKIIIAQRNVSSLKYSKLGNKTYTGKKIKYAPTVKYGSKTLKNGTDYILSYGKNVSTGKATVKVTGKGNYKGSKTFTFYIVPKKVTLSSVKAGKKQATVKYKKVTGASGYQIAYSTSKTKGFKYINVSSKKSSSVIKKLKSKKTYYFKVRAYRTVGKIKKYGSYSSIKSCKIK